MNVKWDYKVFRLDCHVGQAEDTLRKLGVQGWELVAVVGQTVFMKMSWTADKPAMECPKKVGGK